jgi:hypothetical protein
MVMFDDDLPILAMATEEQDEDDNKLGLWLLGGGFVFLLLVICLALFLKWPRPLAAGVSFVTVGMEVKKEMFMFWNRLFGYVWPAVLTITVLSLSLIEHPPHDVISWIGFTAFALIVLYITGLVWWSTWKAPKPLTFWD